MRRLQTSSTDLTFWVQLMARTSGIKAPNESVINKRTQNSFICNHRGPSSSCEMIILLNNSHGAIIIAALRNKKNTSNSRRGSVWKGGRVTKLVFNGSYYITGDEWGMKKRPKYEWSAGEQRHQHNISPAVRFET